MRVGVKYTGIDGLWSVTLDDERVYSTEDRRDAYLFAAQVKAGAACVDYKRVGEMVSFSTCCECGRWKHYEF